MRRQNVVADAVEAFLEARAEGVVFDKGVHHRTDDAVCRVERVHYARAVVGEVEVRAAEVEVEKREVPLRVEM